MSLIRDLPYAVRVLEETFLGTCTDSVTTAAMTTTPFGIQNTKTTASALHTTGDIGDVDHDVQGARVSSGGMVTSTEATILDRTRFPLGTHYQAVSAIATIESTYGSTAPDGKIAVGMTLFHGDSSGGGDLAELSTAMRPSDRVFGSSARTTDMAQWDVTESSGVVVFVSNPGIYDLRGAKKYVQARPRFGINTVTTAIAGWEHSRASADLVFFGGDFLPPVLDVSSPFSTTTTT